MARNKAKSKAPDELENKMIATRAFFDAATMQRYSKGSLVNKDVAINIFHRLKDYVEESKESE